MKRDREQIHVCISVTNCHINEVQANMNLVHRIPINVTYITLYTVYIIFVHLVLPNPKQLHMMHH